MSHDHDHDPDRTTVPPTPTRHIRLCQTPRPDRRGHRPYPSAPLLAPLTSCVSRGAMPIASTPRTCRGDGTRRLRDGARTCAGCGARPTRGHEFEPVVADTGEGRAAEVHGVGAGGMPSWKGSGSGGGGRLVVPRHLSPGAADGGNCPVAVDVCGDGGEQASRDGEETAGRRLRLRGSGRNQLGVEDRRATANHGFGGSATATGGRCDGKGKGAARRDGDRRGTVWTAAPG